MIRLYAIEPESLADWGNFRVITGGLGVSDGRLVANFPRKWQKKIYQAYENADFIRKKRVGAILERIKKDALIKVGLPFDKNKHWIDNALIYRNKFDAIIVAHGYDGNDDIIVMAEDVTEGHNLWDVPREKIINRTLKEISAAVAPLLKISSKIILVDKFFSASDRWTNVLKKFIEIATDSKEGTTFHYFFRLKDDEMMIGGKKQTFESYCQKMFGKYIPEGITVKFSRIDGKKLHARYILTEKGGIRIDWGLDEGKPGQTTDICLMEKDVWEKRLRQFSPSEKVFDFIETTEVIGENRNI